MDSPLVSIIAPCYNGEHYLLRFLDSIINQTYSNLEMIIINDGSTDKTADILNSYKAKFDEKGISFILLNQENRGQASALNNGLKYFKGEYLCCVDSDDKLSEDYVESKLEFMLNNPDAAYCYGNVEFIEENTGKILKELGEYCLTNKDSFFNDIIYAKNIIFSGYMFRTSFFDKIVKNREIYDGRGGQNAQILLPFAWFYGNPSYIGKSTYYYYVKENSHSHSINTSEKIINQIENYEIILDKTLESIDFINTQRIINNYHIHYAKMKFGNAIDSLNIDLIKFYFRELVDLKCFNFHDCFLYLKYTNKIINKFHRKKGNHYV